MKVVDKRFVCTNKEMQDLVVIDLMFHRTCRDLACSDCPFKNEREDCTAALFLNKFLKQAKTAKRSGI